MPILKPSEPPEILFYTSDVTSCDKEYKHGLKGKADAFIELFDSEEEARNVICEKQPFVFAVIARVMADDGYSFYRFDTGRWLTKEVPPRYLRLQ